MANYKWAYLYQFGDGWKFRRVKILSVVEEVASIELVFFGHKYSERIHVSNLYATKGEAAQAEIDVRRKRVKTMRGNIRAELKTIGKMRKLAKEE